VNGTPPAPGVVSIVLQNLRSDIIQPAPLISTSCFEQCHPHCRGQTAFGRCLPALTQASAVQPWQSAFLHVSHCCPAAAHAASKGLQDCIAFAATPQGQQAVSAMLQLHAAHYPEFIQELRGLADGAAVPFEQVGLTSSKSKEYSSVCKLCHAAIIGGFHLGPP
jgi:hypothetical protein